MGLERFFPGGEEAKRNASDPEALKQNAIHAERLKKRMAEWKEKDRREEEAQTLIVSDSNSDLEAETEVPLHDVESLRTLSHEQRERVITRLISKAGSVSRLVSLVAGIGSDREVSPWDQYPSVILGQIEELQRNPSEAPRVLGMLPETCGLRDAVARLVVKVGTLH